MGVIVNNAGKLKSIRLTFVGAHVAAGRFCSAGTLLATLVGRRRMPAKSLQPEGLPASSAGLPLCSAIVCVGPPLLASALSLGSPLTEIPCSAKMARTVAA
jgi:hypothetical protein